jgi:putative SOS response-associated peptidase YedK
MVRAESVARKEPFGDAFRHRRCLLVADGFYEWRRTSSQSFPYFFEQQGGKPFTMAAIWEKSDADGGDVDGCALITRAARAPVVSIHHRMPVLVSAPARERWLDPAFDDVAWLQKMLGGEEDDTLRALPVSARVNSPSHDDPACAQPIDERERRGEQFELFSSAPLRRSGPSVR